MLETIDYWIGDTERGVAVSYRNNDTESAELGGSEHRGLFPVLRCRFWAWRNGCGWPGYRSEAE